MQTATSTKSPPKKTISNSQSHQLKRISQLFVLVEAKFTDINECFDSKGKKKID